jgi:hypothetical protein
MKKEVNENSYWLTKRPVGVNENSEFASKALP